MIKSMTAFGRATKTTDVGRFSVEIQTLNRRHLEMNLSLPRTLNRFELELRKCLSKQLERGQVNVFIGWREEGKESISMTPNLPLAHAVKEAWEKIREEVGIIEAVPLSVLAGERDMLLFEEPITDEKHFLSMLLGAVEEALSHVVEMRGQEGKELKRDLEVRLKALEKSIEEIEILSPEAAKKQREKLTKVVEELFSKTSENEERILREIALFAERVDITEEIVRFRSHLGQFQKLLEDTGRGKTLEFLLQELGREINTIGSKASDAAVAHLVVSVKGEIEKMREQVQNIE